MTPEQLKGSILFSALQGKLVKQIADEPKVDLTGIKNKSTEDLL
ncbi:hypothetical protein [Bariatricus sp. HCP28S3_C2]